MLATGTITWSEGVRKYVSEHSVLYHKPRTQQLVRGLLRKFGQFVMEVPVDCIDRSMVLRFLARERLMELSPWTLNGHVIKLRSFFKWLGLDPNPVKGIAKIPQEDSLDHRTLPEHIIETIIGYLNLKERMVLHDLSGLAANGGFRLSEMLALHEDDLNFERSRVIIPKSKNKRSRPVPMNEVSMPILKRRAAESRNGLLFYTKSGLPIGRENMLRDFQSALKPIGLEGSTFQAMRHFWITRMYNLYPPELVKVIAGNSPETSRIHYIHSDQFQMPSPPPIGKQ